MITEMFVNWRVKLFACKRSSKVPDRRMVLFDYKDLTRRRIEYEESMRENPRLATYMKTDCSKFAYGCCPD